MTLSVSPRLAALLALIGGAVIIGLAPILVRLTETGPAAAGFWRLALAVPLLTLLAWRDTSPAEAGAPDRRVLGITLLAGVFFAADLGFWHYGVSLTSVANATVLTNLSPVVVTAGAWWLFREKPGPVFLIALGVALVGCLVMTLGQGPVPAGRNPLLGDVFSLITAVWYGAYFLAVRQARAALGAARIMLLTSIVGAPLLLMLAVGLGERLVSPTPAGWAACAGLALVHVGGQGAIAWALGRLPAALASLVVFIQPVVAALLGWLLFSEAVAPLQALGGAMILAAVVAAQLNSRNENGRGSPPAAAPAKD